jgi:hypothetical protein
MVRRHEDSLERSRFSNKVSILETIPENSFLNGIYS